MVAKKDPEEEKQEPEKQEPEKEEKKAPKQKEGEEGGQEEEFSPRFQQFYAGDEKEYIKKLEDAYMNSSQEGTKLSKELKKKQEEQEVLKNLVDSDEEIKSKLQEKVKSGELTSDDLFDEDGKLDKNALTQAVKEAVQEIVPQEVEKTPVVQDTMNEKREKNRQIYEKFKEKNPDIEEEEVAADVEENFSIMVQNARNKGKTVDFQKTLEKAYAITTGKTSQESSDSHEKEENEDPEVEGYKNAIQKEESSMSSPQSKSSGEKKGENKAALTQAESRLAKALGLSEKDYREGKKMSQEKDIEQV